MEPLSYFFLWLDGKICNLSLYLATVLLAILIPCSLSNKTIFSSELEISEKGSNRILNICKILKADEYISGINGKNYLNIDDFKQNHINVTFQNYEHPLYHQVFEPFIPKMGAIDLLFNEGDNAEKIIKMSNNLMDDK